MKPTVGRILHYKLSRNDVDRIAEIGRGDMPMNPHGVGQVLPLIASRVWDDEFGPGKDGVNGQVFLDGGALLWVTSVGEGDGEGQWSWPPRV